MKIKSEIWAKALIGCLQEQPNNSEIIVKNFIKKLSRQRQAKLIPTVIRQINKIENNRVINITSSYKIAESIDEKIKVFARKIFPEIDDPTFKYQIDTSVLGGIKLNFRDSEFDASVAHNIDTIKEQLWR